MEETAINQQVEAAFVRLEALHAQAQALPEPSPLLNAALEELSISLAELGVTLEELQVQNEELAATRAAAEADRQHYLALFELAPDGYLVTDVQGVIQEANRAAAHMLNIRQDFAVGKPLLVFLAETEHKEFHRRLTLVQRSDHPDVQHWEFLMQPRGGATFLAGLTVNPIYTQGQLAGLGWLVRDISKQVLAYRMLEQGVEERTRELSTLLEISHQLALPLELGPLLDLILDQLRTAVNYDSATIFKLDGEAVAALAYRGPLPPDDVKRLRFPVRETPGAGVVLGSLKPVIIPDVRGDTPPARLFREATGERLETVYGRTRSWLGVPLVAREQAMGLLELRSSRPYSYASRHAELALAFANQAAVAMENARLYEQARELAAMQERERIARDLHDSVSQMLFSASLSAEVLPRLWERHRAEGQRCLEGLHRLTRGALIEMRSLLYELRPAALAQMSLSDLFGQLGESISYRAGLPVTLDAEPELVLPPEVQVGFYRIAQEALNNVVKHAKASHATLSLHYLADTQADKRGVELRVGDDGQGFSPETMPGQHLGLGLMRERAEIIGASLEIHSRPGQPAPRPASASQGGLGSPGGTEVVVVWTERPRDQAGRMA
jgi:PAS domain S-box-containing protein